MTLQQELAAAIGGEVRFDALSRALYATDASVYQITPAGVVLPRTRDDIVRTVQIAAAHQTSITARGGGTSQAGQAIGAGLILDTSKYLNRILEVNAEARWARVEPGVIVDELNAHLRAHGLRFAPDLSSASRVTVGGTIANNSSGARSIVYGKTIDHVLELQVVLADGSLLHCRPLDGAALDAARAGDTFAARLHRAIPDIAVGHAAEIQRRFPKVLRRVGGYNLDSFADARDPVNLSKIVVGSEGTLGIVVEARINLVPLPSARAVLAVEFVDLLDALAAAPVALAHKPSAIEIMDGFILGHTRSSATLDAIRRTVFSDEGGALLCIEFAGDSAAELPARLAALDSDLAARFRCRTTAAVDPAAQQRIWSLREAALGLSTAMKGDAKSLSFVEDTAVPPERLREYIDRFLQIIRRHGTTAGIYAHASVGCLHVRPVINLKTAEGVRRFEAIAAEVSDLVLEFGGALSGEHGDGLVRGPFMEKMFGPAIYQAFREVKRAFDPDGLFNPGKIVDSPPLTSNLRFTPAYVTPEPITFFNYEEHGGLGRAVEMCSGVGACRKKLEGTMCPSYRATLEEEHSTRGRANVLRLAMTGQLGATRDADEAVRDALDLCLECRACKSECPTGVDMARFKSEFLAGYWKRHGVSRKARAFGHVRATAELASRCAPLSNWIAGSPPARWLSEKLVGVDRRRRLPSWTRKTFSRQAAKRWSPSAPSAPSAPSLPSSPSIRAVIFADTFTQFSEPEIGLAALDVLDAAQIGWRLVSHDCCGRPLISNGLLDEAAGLANAPSDALYDAAVRGEAIVFLEPSCLSAVREDLPALARGAARERAETIARASMLFEEFLERECAAGRAALPLSKGGPSTVRLHVHCHQRAMGMGASARALLGRIPGAVVTDLDAGCCGMAGSFGYTRDHYDLSRAIGELKLFPAARTLPEDGVLAAAGTSCRHQVAHFTAAQPVHPAVLLQSLLPPRIERERPLERESE